MVDTATPAAAALPGLSDIRAAAGRIKGAVLRTPLLPAPRLSEFTGADIFVKYESLQATCSFKERGALNKLLQLTEAERRRGVVAMSAGNHAQAVAYHAGRLGIPATIVMPRFTPYVKIAATRSFGADVVLKGETLAEAEAAVDAIIAERDPVLIHPYDDPDIIAGQGTVGLEIAEDAPELDILVVPVGGGGLIAGIATAMKTLAPATQIIGVEAELYPSVHAALRGEEAVCGGESLAEGIAVKNVGALTLRIIRDRVDDMVLASELAIERAVNAFLTQQKTMAEGAGAAGLAAVLSDPSRFAGKRVGLVLAGGNIDPRLAASIMMRAEIRQGRILAIRVAIPDRPGVLGDITRIIGGCDGNILEVEHHRTTLSVPPKQAAVELIVEAHSAEHGEEIVAALAAAGHDIELATPD